MKLSTDDEHKLWLDRVMQHILKGSTSIIWQQTNVPHPRATFHNVSYFNYYFLMFLIQYYILQKGKCQKF